MPKLKEIRILPPIAIARMGNADQPMESFGFSKEIDDKGFRELLFEPSLEVNKNGNTEQITKVKPNYFKVDENGIKKVKPVAPFFELWGRFDDETVLKPITKNNLGGIRPEDIIWEINVANRKMSRRTKDEDDVIERKENNQSQPLIIAANNQAKVAIAARSNNFKDNDKTITLGAVQTFESTGTDIYKLRFTPGLGKVYHQGIFSEEDGRALTGANQELIKLKSTSKWLKYARRFRTKSDLDPRPRGTMDEESENRSARIGSGMFDDSCDGVISIRIKTEEGKELQANARISAGPPDYSPDTEFIRTVDDELEQLILSPQVTEKQYPNTDLGNRQLFNEIIDIIQKSSDTVQVLRPADNAKKTNRSVSNSDFKKIQSQLDYQNVVTRHRQLLMGMRSLPINCNWKSKAYYWVFWLKNRVSNSTASPNIKEPHTWKMPLFMRDTEGKALTLTLRQRNKINLAEERFREEAESPLCQMKALIYQLAPTAKMTEHHDINISLSYLESGVNLQDLFKHIVKDITSKIESSQSVAVTTLIDALENGSIDGSKLIDETLELNNNPIMDIFNTRMVIKLSDRYAAIIPIISNWVQSIIDERKYIHDLDIEIENSNNLQEIPLSNTMMQIRHRPKGNPITSMPSSAIANCFPGLEMDFRGIWQRFISEHSADGDLKNDWVLHETESWLLSKASQPMNKQIKVSLKNSKNLEIDFNSDKEDRFNHLSQLLFKQNGEPVANENKVFTGVIKNIDAEKVYLNEMIDPDTGYLNRLLPGELTHGLCSPWQHDFRDCVCAYWSANRPDFVNVDIETVGMGEKWMFKDDKKQQSSNGVPLKIKGNQYEHEDLYENWQEKLQFVIKGSTK